MAKHAAEKFEEDTTGTEQIVCWKTAKHVHNAQLITEIEKWLATQKGGSWSVRKNSFQSNLSSCPTNSLEYTPAALAEPAGGPALVRPDADLVPPEPDAAANDADQEPASTE